MRKDDGNKIKKGPTFSSSLRELGAQWYQKNQSHIHTTKHACFDFDFYYCYGNYGFFNLNFHVLSAEMKEITI